MIGFAFTVLGFAILAFALIDVIRCESWRIVYLDKVAWVFIVILLPLLGPILWFTIGKERAGTSARPASTFHSPAPVEFTDDDIDAQVEREIEFHENEARIRRLEAELKAKRDESDPA